MQTQIIEQLKKLTKHTQLVLTPDGNSAIFAAFYICRKMALDKKNILIPDQGGWFTYKKYPKMLEREAVMVKTDYGIIDLEDLKKKLADACCLIYTNPAGYFAEQDIKEIYEVCNKAGVLVILDASGSIGTELCNGNYADLIVCSFGRWKPINVEYGGFISTNKDELFETPKEIFNTLNFDEKYAALVIEKLKGLEDRYKMFFEHVAKVKKELKDFSIVHPDKKGINVVVKFSSDEEKEKITAYCKENNYEFTICPRYIRVEEDAVSIEIKRKK